MKSGQLVTALPGQTQHKTLSILRTTVNIQVVAIGHTVTL